MKLLKDERIEREDGEVKLTIRPITTSQQARMTELGAGKGLAAHIDFAVFCLKNCIDKISIGGQSFDPAELSDRADVSDSDTRAVMFKIATMVDGVAFPSAADIKKSPPQPDPGA